MVTGVFFENPCDRGNNISDDRTNMSRMRYVYRAEYTADRMNDIVLTTQLGHRVLLFKRSRK